MKRLCFFVICCVIIAFGGVESKKLNYPRVLLPVFDDFAVNFTLEIIELGCFNWKVNRPDLISIKPLYDGDEECSHRAVVTPVSRDKRRNTALVLAEEVISSEVLRCDVILDVIHVVEVFTTTRELYLQEAPEKFELKALDQYGNAFSSLEGVQFQWEIHSNAKSDVDHWTNILRFMKFSDSAYHEVPESMQLLEEADVTGFMILLEGINTGTAKVSVRLPYAEYKHVEVIEVDITVLANILIDPSDAAILVGDRIKYKVLQLTKGKLTDISSNSQYYLEAEYPSVAKIGAHLATGLALGKTLVLLRDRNVAQGQDVSCPKATLNVVTPMKIIVELLPYYSWITLEGEFHDIVFTLVTENDQRIVLGDSFRIQSEIDPKYFRLDSIRKNGTHNYGKTLQVGKSRVAGTFDGLSVQAEMQIFKRIQLNPREVILPFDPVQNSRPNRIQFLAEGGDGNYLWSVDNKMMSINQNGLAETRQVEQGESVRKAQVKVALQRNPKLFEMASILFLEPTKLDIVDYNFETALDDWVHVHVALYAEQKPGESVPFTDCSNLQFDLEFSADIFAQDSHNTTLAANACQLISLRAKNPGRTQLKVGYKYQDRYLTDVVQLVVFERLDLLSPESAELVLPVGSSQNVVFTNGPEKLFNVDADLAKKLTFTNGIIDVNEMPVESANNLNLNVFTVICKQLGTTEVRLTMGNSLSGSRKYTKYVFEYSLKVFCLKPRFVNLISREKVTDNCPINSKINPIMEINRDEDKEFIEIEVEVLDANNRRFSNISSLHIDWRLLEGGQTGVENFRYTETVELAYVESVPIPGTFLIQLNKNFQTDAKKNLKLVATVTGYDWQVLDSVNAVAESPPFPIRKAEGEPLKTPLIETELNFMVINSTLLPVNRITVYFKSTRRVPILQGSGHYEVQVADKSKITAKLDRHRNEILITPKEVGDTLLIVGDRCLANLRQEVIVSVVAIDRIELRVSDRVEVAKSIEAIVSLSSVTDYLDIDYDNLAIYDLSVDVHSAAILQMELATDQRNLQRGEIKYKVTGLNVGETKITVNSGDAVSSVPAASVQVFAPLELYPKNSTILVGTSIEIHSRGGPQPVVGTEFSADNAKILKVDSSFVHGLKVGQSKVMGRCVAFDPIHGGMVSFSEDFVRVNVVPLENVKIVAPLVKMISGAVMPAAVWGVPNIPPSILGTLENLKVYWSTNHPEILEIFNVFTPLGVEYSELDAISVRVRALKAGKAQLNVKVITPLGQVLQSTVDVTVLTDLHLERPKRLSTDSSVVVMPPNSNIQLKTNVADAQFKLDASGFGRNLINVSESGLIRSGDEIGYSLVMATSSLDQQLPVLVRIKYIHYILTSLVLADGERADRGAPLMRLADTKIPQGLTLKLKITFHDNVGNEILHSWNSVEHLNYAVSRREGLNVQIENDFKLTVSLLQEVSSVLTVGLGRGPKSSSLSNNVKFPEDYIKLSAYQSANVFPPTTKDVLSASTGDIVCFESMVGQLQQRQTTSKWTTSDATLIKVNERTGLAVVVAATTTNTAASAIASAQNTGGGSASLSTTTNRLVTVTNADMANTIAVRFEIDVRATDSLDFVRDTENFNGMGEHRAYVVMRNRHQGPAKYTNVIARNVTQCLQRLEEADLVALPFACQAVNLDRNGQQLTASMLDMIRVRSGFDRTRGQYFCAVTLDQYEREWVPALRKSALPFSIEARLKSGVKATATVHLIAGVTVTPLRLAFTRETDELEVQVGGKEAYLRSMQIHASHKNVEVVKKMTTTTTTTGSNDGAAFTLAYKVRIVGPVDDVELLSITVQSPDTDQNITVPIDLVANRKCSSRPFAGDSLLETVVSHLGLIISTAIVVIASIYVCLSCSSKQYVNTQVFKTSSPNLNGSNPSFNQSTMSLPPSPGSPMSATGSPASMHRTPQFNQSGNQFPVYGDTGSPISPQRRLNRRFL